MSLGIGQNKVCLYEISSNSIEVGNTISPDAIGVKLEGTSVLATCIFSNNIIKNIQNNAIYIGGGFQKLIIKDISVDNILIENGIGGLLLTNNDNTLPIGKLVIDGIVVSNLDYSNDISGDWAHINFFKISLGELHLKNISDCIIVCRGFNSSIEKIYASDCSLQYGSFSGYGCLEARSIQLNNLRISLTEGRTGRLFVQIGADSMLTATNCIFNKVKFQWGGEKSVDAIFNGCFFLNGSSFEMTIQNSWYLSFVNCTIKDYNSDNGEWGEILNDYLSQEHSSDGSHSSSNIKFKVDSIADLKAFDRKGKIECVSVLGYYSVGDGGGGDFYFDVGSADIDNGGTIIQSSFDATGRWKRVMNEGSVNVKWFGAKGDGLDSSATLNTSAIQNAINTKLQVTLSNGTYSHNGLTMLSNTQLIGISGNGKSTLKSITSAPGITVAGYQVIIENIRLVGDGTGSSGAGASITTSGIMLGTANTYAQSITIRNCIISGFARHGIETTDGVWLVNIDNCYINDNLLDAINIDSSRGAGGVVSNQKNAIWITKTSCTGNGRHGIFVTGLNIVIRDSSLEGNKGAGVSIDYADLHAPDGLIYTLGITIAGNYIENNGKGAIYIRSRVVSASNVFSVENVVIDGNYIYQTDAHFVTGYDATIFNDSVGAFAYNSYSKNIDIRNTTWKTSTATKFVDMSNKLSSNSRIEVPLSHDTKYLNLGEAIVLGKKNVYAINGYFNAKNLVYSSPSAVSDSIPSATPIWFSLPNIAGKIIQSIGIYVDTNATNYSLRFALYARDGKTLNNFTAILYDGTETGHTLTGFTESGYRFLAIPQSYTSGDALIPYIYSDCYLEIAPTWSGGTYLKFGHPVIEYY